MAEVKIQEATIENLKDIQKLNFLLFENEYENWDKSLNLSWTFSKEGEKYFKDKILKSENCALVAIEDNKIVGYLVGGLTNEEFYRTFSKVAELDNTFVLKDYRNLGIGTALHKEFLKWCKSKRIEMIKVQATIQNIKAINFYKKNKFKDYSIVLEAEL